MQRSLVLFAILHCVSSSAQEPVRVGDEPTIDTRAMVEALANRNPAPQHVGTRNEPIFDTDFDWREDGRAWKALKLVIQNAEIAWPELVSHLDDNRYCVTYKSFSGFTYDYTVGGACRDVILINLSSGYFETVQPEGKQPYLALQTPRFLRDPTMLKTWCEERREMKLYELQIEICEWTATDLVNPDVLPDEDLNTRKVWIAGIRRASKSLRESKTAVLWTGFEYDTTTPYYGEPAEAIPKAHPRFSFDVQHLPRATVDDLVEIAIVVRNTGDVPLHGVRVIAQLPDQLKHRRGSEVEFTIDELPIRGSERAVLRVLAQSSGRAICRLHVAADEPTEAEFNASIDVVDRPVRLESSRVTKTEPARLNPVPTPIRTGPVPNSNCCCLDEPWFIP